MIDHDDMSAFMSIKGAVRLRDYERLTEQIEMRQRLVCEMQTAPARGAVQAEIDRLTNIRKMTEPECQL